MVKTFSGRSTEMLLRAERSLLFFNGQYVWHTRTPSGGDHYKFVSPPAVMQAFRSAPIDSGWIPENVVRCGSTARGNFAVMFLPAARHTLSVEHGTKLHETLVWLPSLVFFGYGQNYYAWAVKEPSVLKPDSLLYKAPLPNVFENGGICWGQNTAPKAGTGTIAEAWALFIASPFNGHAAAEKSRSHSADVRTLLRQLAKSRKKFPATELVPAQQGHRTLDATINEIIGGGDVN